MEAQGQDTAAIGKSYSGVTMDRVITRQPPLWRRFLPVVAGVAALVAGAAWLFVDQGMRTLVVEDSRLLIAKVRQGVFDDFIPVRGRVTPLRTVYLDAIEGGRVEQRLKEDGATVAAGDLIVVLSNTTLQLSVTQNEAVVTEQLNNMRTIELQLEQNRLQHRRDLVEMDYQIQRLGRQVSRLANLDDAGVAVRSQLQDAQDELAYFKRRREVTLESQATDARLQETQLAFLKESGDQLKANLALARQNLDALNVRAPIAGNLSGLDVEVGQSIQRGGRLGQIDDPDAFKLRVLIDEYYLGRVDRGQRAVAEVGRENYALTIGKIYPQVTNGEFAVDLLFDGELPEDIRRGQTLQARLTLGDSTPAVLIPNGAFFQDTGGSWIFVVAPDGSQALRRNVRLGRRNSRFIEVLEGLDPDEEVIVSAYTAFTEMDRLSLTAP